MNRSSGILAATLMAAAAPWLVVPAAAAPIAASLGLQSAVTPLVETVQYRRHSRHGWRGGNRGRGFGGVGVGLGIAGAVIGGAIIASQPRGYYSDYGYGSAYDEDYVAGSPDSAVAYCQQRFRSYDPRSGTYLGFDGYRHPCP